MMGDQWLHVQLITFQSILLCKKKNHKQTNKQNNKTTHHAKIFTSFEFTIPKRHIKNSYSVSYNFTLTSISLQNVVDFFLARILLFLFTRGTRLKKVL